MNSGEPKESGLSSDALQDAEGVFEEHKGDLLKEAIALIERGIPPNATVQEAKIEMRRGDDG